jgi:hypothetical protein
MVLVAFAPMAIFGLRRSPPLVLGASAALWLAAALIPNFNLLPAGIFNPLSWQLLFCAGLWAGDRYYANSEAFRPNSYIAVLCVAVIVANFVARGIYNAERAGALHLAHDWFVATVMAARQSNNEHILRLSHFLAVAYIVAGYALRPNAALLRSRFVEPLIWCGQQSLHVFSLGVLLTQVVTVYFENFQVGVMNQLMANLVSIALMSLLGYFMCARDHQPVAGCPGTIADPLDPASPTRSVRLRARSAAGD